MSFLAFVGIRYLNPDLWHPYRGGEKPMELAYFTAVFRSTALPPYDPWFAGGYLNYYYWGYFVIACVNRVAAILPTTAFNLAVPLFFALTVTGAFSLGYNLADGVKRAGLRRRANRGVAGILELRNSQLPPPIFCGLAAAFFTAVIGNLDGIVQVLQGFWTTVIRGGCVAWVRLLEEQPHDPAAGQLRSSSAGILAARYCPGRQQGPPGTSPNSRISHSSLRTCTPT